MCRGKVGPLFRPALGHGVFREQLHWLRPRITVLRRLKHGLARCLVLVTGIGQVVHIQLAVPLAQHGLVVIRPRLLSTHRLYGVNAHHGLQPAVVPLRASDGLACIAHHVTVILLQTFNQLLVGHEHRAMLMTYWERHPTRLVLKGLEVLRAMGAVNLVSVGVVINVVPVAYLRHGRPLGERLRERLRCRAPRPIGAAGKRHLDITHRARVVLKDHHVMKGRVFQNCRINHREVRVVEELRW